MEKDVQQASAETKRVAGCLIAATNSGCGKTTITMGLLRSLKRKQLNVQPFKCGPDYIDTQYHRIASGCESVNLDTWFASERHIKQVFEHYGQQADVCVVEGVMGLYDGYCRWHGSSGEIAHLLHLPVVLVVNARSMAFSVAPILYGYKHFAMKGDSGQDAPLELAGVIFNQVGSERHKQLLRSACDEVGLRCLGMIPRVPDMQIPSRHLGLTLENKQLIETLVEKAAAVVEEYVDVDGLLEMMRDGIYQKPKETLIKPHHKGELHSGMLPIGIESIFPVAHKRDDNSQGGMCARILVARDEAFNFVYRENIDVLRQCGEVVFFSPLHDQMLPPATDFLYLPGGYPEFFLEHLSANEAMRNSIREYIEQGGRCLAECGGMMYLCQHVAGEDGRKFPMVGVLNQDATMVGMHLHLGYRTFKFEGRTWRGHEFHYSSVPNPDNACTLPIEISDGHGNMVDSKVYKCKNLLASYIHLYWGE